IVEPEDYRDVARDVQKALEVGGLKTIATPASWLLRFPTKVLTLMAGGAIENLIADQLTTLKSPKLEVLLHPSVMVIRGRKADADRAHAILTEHLAFTKAYLTWEKEANAIEDRLRSIWQGMRERGDPESLAE